MGAETSRYNATVYEYDEDGKEFGVFVAEVEYDRDFPHGIMVRSNALQFTGLEHTRQYHEAFVRRLPIGHTIKIVNDDCEGYKKRLRELSLPSQYRR